MNYINEFSTVYCIRILKYSSDKLNLVIIYYLDSYTAEFNSRGEKKGVNKINSTRKNSKN